MKSEVYSRGNTRRGGQRVAEKRRGGRDGRGKEKIPHEEGLILFSKNSSQSDSKVFTLHEWKLLLLEFTLFILWTKVFSMETSI